tara:strand:+ start:1208 stop:1726 length:519 start_codon:yes stop_codon:yes gene_type:complete
MKNKFFLITAIFIFVIIFVVFYKSLQDTNIYTPNVKINNKIPLFSANLFYLDEVVDSSNLFNSNKFYLLNIWSSWCVPCRQEHSFLMYLSNNKALAIIGLNYKDTKSNAKFFLDELGNPYEKIIFDKKGINAIEWGAYGVPETFLIHKGMIIKRFIGPLNEKLVKEIESSIR